MAAVNPLLPDEVGGEEPSVRAEPAVPPARGITLRAAALGLALMAVNAYWITVVEVRWYTLDGTSLPLFITPVFLLFCCCLANFALRRITPQRALRQPELLTIYIMLVVGSSLAS